MMTVSNILTSLVLWKNHDKATSGLISAVFHILQYLKLLKRSLQVNKYMEIHDNVCHVVDRSSHLAYTILLWQDDQADRFKKLEVSRIN